MSRREAVRLGITLVLAALFLALFQAAGLERRWYYASHALLSQTLPPLPHPDPRIVLVAMDDATLQDPALPKWGPGILSRRAHAKALRELTAAGARVIGFDVAFLGESPDDGKGPKTPDAELRAALDAAPSTALVVEARPFQLGGTGDRFLDPLPLLVEAPSVRLASPLVRRYAGSGQALGVEVEQPRPDGRTLNALPFELYKAATSKDDLRASFRYETVGTNNLMLIRWPGGRPDTLFPTISFRDLWSGGWKRTNPDMFRGRIVLIGSVSTLGRTDVMSTPMGTLPGVVVHACATQTLLDGSWVRDASSFGGWLATLAALVVVLSLYSLRPLPAFAAILATAGAVVAASVVAFRFGYWIGPWQPLFTTLCFGLVGFVWRMSFFRSMLDRFAGEAAAEQLARRGEIETRTRSATVLFADVQGYTHLAERMDPAELMEVLNRHYGWIDGIVQRHGGRIDKHIGDAVMAVFEGRDHAREAVEAALEVVASAKKRSGPAAELGFGLGVHTGTITTGTLGSGKQEYGSIGDAVNVAARLEQATRTLGVPLLASVDTVQASGLEAKLTRIEPLPLKGRTEPVEVYTVGG